MKKVLMAALALLLLGAVAGGSIAWAKTSNGNLEGAQNELSLDQSRTIAEQYLLNGATYKFDGMEGSLVMLEAIEPNRDNGWTFVFEFQTRQAGHGDRSGQMLAQVITTHTAVITVQGGEVVSAVCCDTFEW